MKQLTPIIFCVFTFSVASKAQQMNTGIDYKTALGVKVFDGGGLSLKTFIKGNNALEGILYFWNKRSKNYRFV